MDLPLQCQCGALRGVARNVSRTTSIRAVCYCDDCQAFAHHLGRAHDVLDENAGSDISSIAPSSISIDVGVEHLRCVRLTSKGLFRWYAECCQTPIANSPALPKIPFAGVYAAIADHETTGMSRDELLGPLEFGMNGRFGIGELPPWAAQGTTVGFLMSAIPFLVRGFFKGQNQPSPFFNAAFEPRVKPYVLTAEERENLRPLCGPEPHDQPAY